MGTNNTTTDFPKYFTDGTTVYKVISSHQAIACCAKKGLLKIKEIVPKTVYLLARESCAPEEFRNEYDAAIKKVINLI